MEIDSAAEAVAEVAASSIEAEPAAAQAACEATAEKGDEDEDADVEEESTVVTEGSWIVWDINGEKSSLLQVKKGGSFKMLRLNVPMGPIVGARYGSMFELNQDKQCLVLMQGKSLLEETTKEKSTDKDNSTLRDNGANQSLSEAELQKLKESAKDGKEIIDALCSSSKSFESKTVFSQEKYRKKKAKKYLAFATVRRPTAQVVADSYFRKAPIKVYNLRPDSLAVLLNMANTGPNQEVLVMETCSGVITAAVTERLGGYGHCCSTYAGRRMPNVDSCMRFFNFSKKAASATSICSLLALEGAFQQAAERDTTPPADAEQSATGEAPEGANSANLAQQNEGRHQESAGDSKGASPELLDHWASCGFSSCIIAAPALHPVAALKRLLPLLAPSASFAVFANHTQVLPARTHPMMAASGTGGFILSGIKVLNNPPPERDPSKRKQTNNKRRRR